MWDDVSMRIQKRIEAHEKGYRQNVGIIGREGSGKTRFLIRLQQSLFVNPRFISVGFDCRIWDLDHLIERWMGALLSGLFQSQSIQPPSHFQSLLSASVPIIPKTVERMKSLKKMVRREKPSAVIRELFSLTGVLAEETSKKIILILEEFQELEKLPCPDPFALLGKQIMVEKNTLYLVSSSKPEKAREIFRDKLSLLFGNFEIMETGPLEFEEAYALIHKDFGDLALSARDQHFLISMTDGWPVSMDLILSTLRSIRMPSGNTPLLQAFEYELFDGEGRIFGIFQHKLNLLSALFKEDSMMMKTLLAIAFGKKKAQIIGVFIGKTARETKKILQRLLAENVIVKRGSFYGIEDPLFRFWLREVWVKKQHVYSLDHGALQESLCAALRHAYLRNVQENENDLSQKVETLLREFRNDAVEMNQKRVSCPHFMEIASRPTNGRIFPIHARNQAVRWICQVAQDPVREEHVSLFLDELKRFRKRVQRKVLIALKGVDQNARLMAQEARIQIWGLRDFNALLDLYNLPKIIPMIEEKNTADEPPLGALAPSLHSA
ncbi:MAG: hypothetical protein HYZ85_05730 [Candidatus Omnitrophica bacterium]|nr:hypothetical protein [Candidatus Omnitrophota bacterium]